VISPFIKSSSRADFLPAIMRAMTARKIGLAVTVVAVVPSMWLVHFVSLRREARRGEAKRVEAAEIMQMAPYEHDLRVGMTKEQGEEYLALRQTAFVKADRGHDGFTFEVKIGEEKGDGIVCDRWYAYAAMDFDRTDRLSKVHLVRVGHCL
jgi:hypothetical protein